MRSLSFKRPIIPLCVICSARLSFSLYFPHPNSWLGSTLLLLIKNEEFKAWNYLRRDFKGDSIFTFQFY